MATHDNTGYQRIKAVLKTSSKNTNDFYVSLRKNSQNVLIYLADSLQHYNKRFYTKNDYPKHGGSPGVRTSNIPPAGPVGSHQDSQALGTTLTPAPWRSGYSTIVPIVSPANESPEESITKLIGHTEKANRFFTFEMTSAQASLLIPKIRIFKVDYKTVRRGPVNQRYYEMVRPPQIVAEREIEFDAFIKADSVDAILKSTGYPQRAKLPGTGIKSFEWNLLGVNPAEVDANITATLQVYFNSIDDVFLNNLKQRQLSTTKGIASFLDLIVFSPPLGAPGKNSTAPCTREIADGTYFEIKAEVGWQTPPRNTGLFTDEQIEIIETMHSKYFLQLTDHEFEFKEDGSAILTANYRARSKLVDERFNVLNDIADAVSSEIESLQAAQEVYDPSEHGQDEAADAIGEAEENLKVALDRQYRHIIRELVTKHAYTTDISTDVLLNFRGGSANLGDDYDSMLNPENLHEGKVLSYSSLFGSIFNPANPASSPDNQALFNNVISQVVAGSKNFTIPEGPGPIGLVGDRTIGPGELNVRKRTGSYTPAQRVAEEVTDLESHLANIGEDKLGTDTTGDGHFDHVKINYFYLGDILEVFFYNHNITSAIEPVTDVWQTGFVIMDMEYVNTMKVLEHTTLSGNKLMVDGMDYPTLKCIFDFLKPSDRRKYLSKINLANIPINAELFFDFLKEKIISQQRVTYYVDDFITDLLNQFVKPIVANNGVIGTPRNTPANVMLTATTDYKVCPLFAKKHNEYSLGYDDGPRGRPSPLQNNKLYDVLCPRQRMSSLAPDWGSPFRNWHTIIGTTEHYLKETAGAPGGVPLAPFHSPTNVPRRRTPPPGSPPTSVPNKPDYGADIKIIALLMHFNNFDGTYEKNIKAGISNFVIGLDRGLLKNVSFNRVDQAMLREARVAKSRTFAAGQLRELYNVTLEMIGNTLCKPGQIIYVEPNPAIYGKPTTENSPARILGMGGYHLVVDVSNTIDSDGWQTTVKALHVSVPPSS